MQIGKYSLPIGERTLLMGVLNVTPDSFSDGGEYFGPEKAIEHVKKMVSSGADIIDIGAESSRPGAKSISSEEEIKRIDPVLSAVISSIDVPVSIDTYKSSVARFALERGAKIVNDITGLRSDSEMAKVIAKFDAGVILMHMKGTPLDMQQDPSYTDLVGEIYGYLDGSIEIALKAGVDKEKIIIDPGIGFGKKLEHNLVILKELKRFKDLGKPILIGTSRKSFIGKITGKDTNDRLMGTAASCALGIVSGANIIRVHDVDEMKSVAKITDAIKGA